MSPADEAGASPRERMLAGELYLADDPELVQMARRAARVVERFNTAGAHDDATRRAALDELLGSIGASTEIRPPLRCDYGTHLHIGDRTFVNFGLVALDVAPITIGDDVMIGPNVQLLTPTHPVEPGPRRDKWEAAHPIVIRDNAWLGGGAIVLAGVTIGADAVVGAGSVVTRDVPDRAVVAGNPARVLRRLP